MQLGEAVFNNTMNFKCIDKVVSLEILQHSIPSQKTLIIMVTIWMYILFIKKIGEYTTDWFFIFKSNFVSLILMFSQPIVENNPFYRQE